jgi:hypothetical protein
MDNEIQKGRKKNLVSKINRCDDMNEHFMLADGIVSLGYTHSKNPTLRGPGSLANYTDRATAACRRSLC